MTGAEPEWGFFGHRRINQLAVYTLPPEVAGTLRQHTDYLSEHAVDPDKRRYAAEFEAVRHYIDLDHWGQPPFGDLPRSYSDAVLRYGSLSVRADSTTEDWRFDTLIAGRALITNGSQGFDLPLADYRRLWSRTLLPSIEREQTIPADSLRALDFPLPAAPIEVTAIDSFSTHGILPYHLLRHQRWLTEAFAAKDLNRILQLAAELGHYVADAHVPLHTTENYNGQLTGQLGIHAFWESRIPELFADADYDYLVGPAEYIPDPQNYYWDIVLTSHTLVDSVLATEARLRRTFPGSQQLCYEERQGQQLQLPCTEFARAWSEAMDGMVEDRFRAAIRSVGSAWYSAWVDAGQPDLSDLAVDSPDAPLAPSASGEATSTHQGRQRE